MILSAYERKQSPWVHIQFSQGKGAKKHYRKTTIRKTDPDKAKKIAKAINQIEAELLSQHHGESPRTESGWQWVPGYLKLRYASKESTLRIYRVYWDHIALFLRENKISSPALLERAHCFNYVEWRQSAVKEKSKKTVGINSVISELKLLGLIMDEAILRGYALTNPARRLKLEREESKQKPELTDEEILKIYEALRTRPEWMQKSFHIALHTGVRFSETHIARADVHLIDNSIVIEKPKGGRRRAFSIPIYASIVDMIKEFMAGRQAFLWQIPPKDKPIRGLIWSKFFAEIGLSHACFHCTRVTFISRGARAGIPQSSMMKMVNHASAEVHRVYQRLAPADALALQALIPIPSAAGATLRNPKEKAG